MAGSRIRQKWEWMASDTWKGKWKNLKKEHILTAVLLGAILLVIAIPTSSDKQKKAYGLRGNPSINVSEEGALLEQQLEHAFAQMEGVGEVDTTIFLEPFADDHTSPEIRGILVLSAYGDDPVVRLKIQETVMTLFQIDAHRIKVMKMK